MSDKNKRIEAGVRMIRAIAPWPDDYLRLLLSRPESEVFGVGVAGMTVGQVLDLAAEREGVAP